MSDAAAGDTARGDRYDVLGYSDGSFAAVPAGDGSRVRGAHEREGRKRRQFAAMTTGVAAVVVVTIVGVVLLDALIESLVIGLVVGVVSGALRSRRWDHTAEHVPELVATAAPPRVVRQHVDDFDPNAVTDPFE